jgi:integrase/recombinase XerD
VAGLLAAVAPFEALVLDFLAYLEFERGLSRNTLDAYRGDLAQFGRHLGPRSAAAAGPAELAGFLAALGAGAASAATLQRKAACLRSFYRHLRRAGIIDHDPTAGLRLPPRDPRPPEVPTAVEVARLLAGPRGEEPGPLRDRALLGLLCASGIRASEAIGLHVADVDRGRRVVRVRGRGARERVVPVARLAMTAVGAYLDRGRPALVGPRPEPHLFVNRRGVRLTRQGLYKIVQGYAREAGLEVSPNTLRRTYAARALAGGEDIRLLKEALGHASIASTQLYRPAR